MNPTIRFFCIIPLILLAFGLRSQAPVIPEKKEVDHTTGAWLGIYTKYHFNDRWAYHGEYHARMREGIKEMAQVYLRFGATYRIQKYLDFTVGIVTPFYWNPNPERENTDNVVPQYRFWQQAILATPFDHIKVFHQLRLEQRWRRDYVQGAPFELTHRFRYKLTVYVPLNHRDFGPNTLFLALYEEIFMQAGKTVVFNHFEDNRAFAGLGYNLDEKFQFQVGYMNSYRHNKAPYKYQSRHIGRVSIIHHLDFHLTRQPKARDIPIH